MAPLIIGEPHNYKSKKITILKIEGQDHGNISAFTKNENVDNKAEE